MDFKDIDETESKPTPEERLHNLLKMSAPGVRSKNEFPNERSENDEKEKLWRGCVTFDNSEYWKDNQTFKDDLGLGNFKVTQLDETPDSLAFTLVVGADDSKGNPGFEVTGLIAGELLERYAHKPSPMTINDIPVQIHNSPNRSIG